MPRLLVPYNNTMITTILSVCSANQCRSPYIEFVLRHKLNQLSSNSAAQVTISSAGTMAKNGHPIHPSTARNIKSITALDDADLSSFTSTYLTPAIAKKQDLILCATDAHRQAVVKRTPAAARRTFTLGRLAEALKDSEGVHRPGATPDLAALVTLVNNLPGPSNAYDCADPIGKSEDFFDKTAAQLTRDISVVSRWISATNNL